MELDSFALWCSTRGLSTGTIDIYTRHVGRLFVKLAPTASDSQVTEEINALSPSQQRPARAAWRLWVAFQTEGKVEAPTEASTPSPAAPTSPLADFCAWLDGSALDAMEKIQAAAGAAILVRESPSVLTAPFQLTTSKLVALTPRDQRAAAKAHTLWLQWKKALQPRYTTGRWSPAMIRDAQNGMPAAELFEKHLGIKDWKPPPDAPAPPPLPFNEEQSAAVKKLIAGMKDDFHAIDHLGRLIDSTEEEPADFGD